MSFVLALIQKVSDLLSATPFLPMDLEYSYAARRVEAERIRKSQVSPLGFPLR